MLIGTIPVWSIRDHVHSRLKFNRQGRHIVLFLRLGKFSWRYQPVSMVQGVVVVFSKLVFSLSVASLAIASTNGPLLCAQENVPANVESSKSSTETDAPNSTAPQPNAVEPPQPEMMKLQHLVGTWDERVELPDGKKLTAVGETIWILGGTHLQSTYLLHAPDGKKLHQMSLLQWDAAKKEFRGWMFSDHGETLEATGKLDETKQQLTLSTARDSRGQKSVTTMLFEAPDKVNWTIRTFDRNGNITLELTGIDTRRTDSDASDNRPQTADDQNADASPTVVDSASDGELPEDG